MINQKGFTYPLTLSILILVILVLSMNTEQLLIERRFHKETETILKQEYYLHCSMKTIETQLQNEKAIIPKGILDYEDATVEYGLGPLTGNEQKISFTVRMNSGEIAVGHALYDITLKKMIKWLEKN